MNESKGRRPVRGLWILAGVVLGLIALVALAVYLYDRHWENRLQARLDELRRKGWLLSYEEMLQRGGPEDAGPAPRVYADAFEKLRETPDLLDELPEPSLGTKASPQYLDLLRKHVGSNREALEAMNRAAEKPGSGYPLKPVDLAQNQPLPCAGPVREGAKLYRLQSYLLACSGKPDEAAATLVAGFGLPRSLGQHIWLIEEMVRIASDSILLDGIERSLAVAEMSPQSLRRVREALAREQNSISIRLLSIYEVSTQHDAFEAVRNDPDVTLHSFIGTNKAPLFLRLYPWVPGWSEADELFILDTMAKFISISELPPADALKRAREEMTRFNTRLRESGYRYVLAGMLMPAVSRAQKSAAEAKAHMAAARTALLVEEFRVHKGRWPKALVELVPEIAPELPADPFGDGSITYLPTDDGVVLYSYGPNMRDDGGRSQEELEATRPRPADPDAYDLPFRLLDPERRGAKQRSFADVLREATPPPEPLKAAGYDAEKLLEMGFEADWLRNESGFRMSEIRRAGE